MWYVKSGQIQGVSNKEILGEAFIELFDVWVKQTGHFPQLGVLGAGCQNEFTFRADNTMFFSPEWTLFAAKRIPRMSIECETPQEFFASLFDTLPPLDVALELVNHAEDEILEADTIDAPNSRENFWDDVIEVPEGYEFNAGRDASSEPHELG